MSPKWLKVGQSYRNKGAGRTCRTILEISKELRPPHWYSSNPRPDEPVVRFKQVGKLGEHLLYLSSFASWCGSLVK